MPTYDYYCTNCGHTFEQLRKIDDRYVPEQEPCPCCGNKAVEYMMSAPSIGYTHPGSMRTTDSFNDRLKEIKKKVPPKYQDNLNNNIR